MTGALASANLFAVSDTWSCTDLAALWSSRLGSLLRVHDLLAPVMATTANYTKESPSSLLRVEALG